MKVRRIQHVVPQMSHKEPLREITMKRLRHKFIFSYFFHKWLQRYIYFLSSNYSEVNVNVVLR